MKTLLTHCLILCGFSYVKAQESIQRPRGYHKHDGFYLSYSLGPVFGNVMNHITTTNGSAYTLKFTGTGGEMDFKMGWAIKRNIILHATFLSNMVAAPVQETTIDNHTTTEQAADEVELGDTMLGVGTTYYFMPYNILVSGTVGLGKFMISGNENEVVTEPGFSMQLKAGKEFWIAKNWGIGLGLTYGKTSLTHKPSNGMVEKLNSDRFGILLNTTFN